MEQQLFLSDRDRISERDNRQAETRDSLPPVRGRADLKYEDNRQHKNRDSPHIYEEIVERENRLSQIGACISVIISAIAISLTIVIAQKMKSRGTAMGFTQWNGTFPTACIDCLKLNKNSYKTVQKDEQMEELDKRMEDEVQKCCARDTEQLSALLQMILRQQDTNLLPVPKLPSNTTLIITPVYAHKQLLAPHGTQGEMQFPKTDHVILTFNPSYNDPHTETARGVEISSDYIEIKHNGLYYVYTSVYFSPNSNKPVQELEEKSWYQSIHRISANSPQNTGILLRSAHTGCETCVQTKDTSYIGGTFYLKAGDRIRICLSGYGVVKYSKETTYFGLYMLTSRVNEM